MISSTAFLKNILESKGALEKTIDMNHFFPCSPFYSEFQKIQGEKYLGENEHHKGFAHFAAAHCVALRHAAVNMNRDKLAKKKLSKNNLLTPETFGDFRSTHQQYDQSFHFSKASFPEWLYSLPPEWTVVQISEMWQGQENLKMLGYGPPPLIYSLPKLVIARFHGGQNGSILNKELEQPCGSVSGGSLLAELKSILEGNRSINKDFRGNRDQYWKLKQQHHDQMKVLVESLENWWLDFCKCLLVGELSEPADKKLLNSITSAVVSLINRIRKRTTVEEEAWIKLLLSCYGHLTCHQFVRGLMKILKATPRSPLVTEIRGYLKTVQPELSRFKDAKRNPVILVLDKVIQQLPWESIAVLSTTPISRLPSLHFLNSLAKKYSFDEQTKETCNRISPTTDLKLRSNGIQVNPNLAYYLVNPGQDLPGVQLRLQPILEEIWGKNSGLSGTVPVEQQLKQSLMERDIFLYCGHGSGSKYLPNDHLLKLDCRAASILMGCSSGQLSANGRVLDPTGAPIYYLMAGSPGIIGMLWEVTDIDCDRFTVRLIDLLLGVRKGKTSEKLDQTPPKQKPSKSELPSPPDKTEPEILRAVAASRTVTKNFLTGAAAVAYGLPIRTLDFHR